MRILRYGYKLYVMRMILKYSYDKNAIYIYTQNLFMLLCLYYKVALRRDIDLMIIVNE
jgi:hypothetical protein